jgi:hypothetical protein
MSKKACLSALMKCSFGLVPSPLVVTPEKRVLTGGLPAATIFDNKPNNVITFGMCNCPANPAVASAIAASMGAVTQAPCKPVNPAPWLPGAPTVLTNNQPALNKDAKLLCMWGGVIEITYPGQVQDDVP